MKRWAVVVVGISLVLFGLTSLIGHQSIDSYFSGSTQLSLPGATQKGWPVAYRSTGNIAGATCPGINGPIEDTDNGGGCDVPGEFNQPIKLALDFIFWLALCSFVGYGLYMLRRRSPIKR